jgi:hypothetical protein
VPPLFFKVKKGTFFTLKKKGGAHAPIVPHFWTKVPHLKNEKSIS